MHKIILIFIPFLIIFNSQCHLPPSQESQNKDFDQISTLIETSDTVSYTHLTLPTNREV